MYGTFEQALSVKRALYKFGIIIIITIIIIMLGLFIICYKTTELNCEYF